MDISSIEIVNETIDVMLKRDFLPLVISIMVTIPTLAISIIALIFSRKSYDYSEKRLKVEHAIKQAEVYKEVIKDIAAVSSFIEAHEDILALINKVETKKMNDFTKEELSKNYNETERKALETFFTNTVNSAKFLPTDTHISHLITGTLNTLEYFAMYFNHNVADDEIVYQSLHMSYLSAVQYLYYFISEINSEKKQSEKAYTNVIDLFLRWRDEHARKDEELQKIEDNRKKEALETIKPKKKL